MIIKVDDRRWKQMMKDLLMSETVQAQAGFFDGKTPAIYDGKSEADIMAINEYGAKIKGGNIPPRRAIGKVARQKVKKLRKGAVMQMGHVLRGRKVNMKWQGQILQEGIANNINNPTGMRRNKARTIKNKGFDNPLTETGHLGSSVTTREIKNVRNS